MPRSISVIALLAIVLLQTNLVTAQEPAAQESPANTSVATTPGFCDPYFKAGSVAFEVEPSLRQTVPGATMTFSGKVKNSNAYPIPAADILVGIYRVGDLENENDDTVVEQVLVAENQTFTSNGELPLTFTWQVPSDTLGGVYKAAFSLRTGNELTPVDFTDREAGNQEVFTITNEAAESSVVLLSQTAKLQGKSYDLNSMPTIELNQPLTASVSIKNFGKESKTVPLQWSQSAGDSYKKENIRHSKTQVVTLAAGETKVLTYDIQPQSEGLVEVVAVTQDGGVKSLVPIRFVQSGHSATDVIFSGLTGPIFTTEGEQTLFACLKHYEQDLASQHSLEFTLKDSNGKVIHNFEKPLSGAGSSEVVSSKFTPESAYNAATLSVALKYNGVVVEEAVTTYDCAAIDSSKCTKEAINIFKEYGMYILLGLAVVALIVALVLYVMKKRKYNKTAMLFFGFLLLSSFGNTAFAQPAICTAPPNEIHHTFAPTGYSSFACPTLGYTDDVTYKYVTQSSWEEATNAVDGPTNIGECAEFKPGSPEDVFLKAWKVPDATCSAPTASCTYSINALCVEGKCKDALAVETSFGTGQLEAVDVFGQLTITATVGGVSQLLTTRCDAPYPGTGSCSQSQTHTVNGASIDVDVTASLYLSGIMRGEAAVRGCTLQTTGSPPTVPVITGPTTGNVSAINSFSFTSTDPDNDDLRYGIDWDNNGSVDEWAPSTGYVLSGLGQLKIHSWPAIGTYTFRAMAEDDNGSASGWASHTITISVPAGSCTWNHRVKSDCSDTVDLWGNVYNTNWCAGGDFSLLPQCAAGLSAASDGQPAPPGPPLQCKLSDTEKLRKVGTSCTAGPAADLKINGSDVGITVNTNTPLTLDWTSTNAASCTLFGAGLPGGSVPLTANSVITATVSDNYILTCDGAIDQVAVTVNNQAPNPPTITHPTGVADFGVDTTFTITGTDPDNDQVFYEIDWNRDDTYDVATAQVPSGTGAPGVYGWSATGPQTFKARTVDVNGLRSGWTEYTITINDPNSAPTATLEASVNGGAWSSADQTVNSTDSVALRWSSTDATDCSGTGTGFSASGPDGSDNVDTPALGGFLDFDVTCTGPLGSASDNLKVSTLQLPNLTVGLNQAAQFGTFDSSNSTYSQVTVKFRTQNNGGSNTASQADYKFEFDLNNDGSYETDVDRTNSIGIINAADGENDNETVIGPIPFGTHGVRITVDSSSPDKVNETDEGDNVYTGTISTNPPDPDLSITAEPTQVQNGQGTTLSWTVGNPYDMSCEVYGPGMTTQSFNPLSSAVGSYTTGAITAKSIYTLSCTAAGTTFTDTVTVETQGVIEEI